MIPKIGMRNIKTATAVFLCVLISNELGLEYPFYAAIAAIITMKNSISNSFKVGKNRMMGTAVGALTGLIFALIQPENAILCGLGMVVLIYVCNLLKWNDSVVIAGIVFMAIMVNMDGRNPFEYSINRLTDTFMGISIALTVNYLFVPYNCYEDILKKHGEISKKVTSVACEAIESRCEISMDGIRAEISKLENQMNIFAREKRLKKRETEKMGSVASNLRLYSDICIHLSAIDNMREERHINEMNGKRLKSIGILGCNAPENTNSAYGEPDVVFNYHLGRILDSIEKLELS